MRIKQILMNSTTAAYLTIKRIHTTGLLLAVLLLSCTDAEKQKREEAVRIELLGEWKLCKRDIPFNNDLFMVPGMTFFQDSMDVHTGFFTARKDSLTGRIRPVFVNNYCKYELSEDSIFIKNPLNGKRELIGRFLKCKADTLYLETADSDIITYQRLLYKMDTLPDFDQIIYSSSGCYGSCPILDISVDKKGKVLFNGEGYVSSTGYYSGQLNPERTGYLFSKFRKANPLSLSDHYSVGHTDDETITTTYIKDGKIVKSINDYGVDCPPELMWAYVCIGNSYNSVTLHPLPESKPFYKKLHYLRFKKGKLLLRLEKSESFYLWTELRKSESTQSEVKAIYTMVFAPSYEYWGPDPDRLRPSGTPVKSIISDGQLFKFVFDDGTSATYDLGYNFVQRNFTEKDFTPLSSWEQ